MRGRGGSRVKPGMRGKGARNEGEEGAPRASLPALLALFACRRDATYRRASTFGPFCLPPGRDEPRGKHFWRFSLARRTEIPGQARNEGVGPGRRGPSPDKDGKRSRVKPGMRKV